MKTFRSCLVLDWRHRGELRERSYPFPWNRPICDLRSCIQPLPFLKFFSGDYFAGTLQQDGENLKRLARQFQLYSSLAQFSC